MTPGPASSHSEPPQVTIVGDNSQIVPLVGFFVGGDLAVRVYTDNPDLEETLAIYPGVAVRVVSADFAEAPGDLPPPPYIVAVEDTAQAQRIRAWMPRTSAIFLASNSLRRRRLEGFLTFQSTPEDARRAFIERLAVLRRVDQLETLARMALQPVILMYGDPDPDAVGSALALATLWRAAGAKPLIRYTGDVQRYQNRLLLQYLKEDIEVFKDSEREACDLLAVVDCQPGFWKTDPPQAQVIIDHHPVMESSIGAYVDIRPYGATCSIFTEYLIEAGLPIDRKLATALLYGVSTDTDDLQRNVTPADVRAYEILMPRSDRHFLMRLNKSQVPMLLLDWIAWGLTHRVVYNDMILVHFGAIPTPDVLVQAADLILLTCGINWAVCAGVHGEKLIVVFRGDGHHQDVGRRAAQAFGKLGSAGGHRTMGRAEIPIRGVHVDNTVEILVDNLFRRMSPRRRSNLVRILRNHLHGAGPEDPARAVLGE